MKKFIVSVPVTGMASCLVIAENEDDAIEKAFEYLIFDLDEWKIKNKSDATVEEAE